MAQLARKIAVAMDDIWSVVNNSKRGKTRHTLVYCQ